MAENAGAIKYTVSADTADMLKAEAVIDKSLTKISKEFDKADVAVKNFEKSQKTLGNTVNKMGQVLDKNGNIVEDLTLEYRKLATEASGSFNKLNTQISKTAKGVNSGLSNMGRASGQAGIQFQQFIGQVQGGQSVMLALSQQSADLGFVLGAPLVGAIVGIGASIIGMAAAFGEAEVEMRSTSDIAKQLVGDFSKLDAESQKLARDVLSSNISKQEKALKSLVNQQAEYLTSLSQVFDSTEESSQKHDEYTANILALELALKKSKDSLNSLGTDQTDYVAILDKQQTSIGDLITSTVHLGNTYGFNARELAVYEAELLGANDAQIAALNLSFDTIESKEAETEATKKQAVAEKQLKDERSRLGAQVQSIGLSPEDALIARFERENELLRQSKEQQLLTEEEFLTRSAELNKQHEDNLQNLRDKTTKDAIVNFEALENQVIGTFASIASGAQSGKEAIQSLAQSILTQLIGSLIKMGIQAAIGQTTAVATGTATATALSTAYATPAALVSLASFGANAAPAAAGISSTVALSNGLSLAGGREHGGPVQAGKMYQVGEGGKPEIFSSGGKNFMIPGDNGNVTSNADAFGGDGGQAVNVSVVVENNAPNAAVSTSSSDDGRIIKLTINEAANQIVRNQGPIARALKQSTNVTMKANK